LLEEEQVLKQLQQQIQSMRADWTTDAEEIAHWKRVRKQAGRGQMIGAEELTWLEKSGGPCTKLQALNDAVVRCEQLQAYARKTFEEELSEKRTVLREIVSAPDFQEAVFLSSPHMFAHGLLPYLRNWRKERNAESKRVERQLIAYLQRFVGKNETASFFGPINYGSFARVQEKSNFELAHPRLHATYEPELQHREAFMAYWAVQALADAFAALPAAYPHMVPVRSFLHRFSAEQALAQSPRTQSTPDLQQILLLADGSRTVGQLAQTLDCTIEEIRPLLHSLVERQRITLSWEVPITEVRCLEWLLNSVEQVGEENAEITRWTCELRHLKQLKDAFASAPLETKAQLLAEAEALFHTLTGQAAQRHGGQMYADRNLFYEECRGHLNALQLGTQVQEQWEAQLAPILRLCASQAAELKEQQRGFALSVYRALYGDTERPIPYLRFLADAMHHEQWEEWSQRFASLQSTIARRLTQIVESVVQQKGLSHEVSFSAEELDALLRESKAPGNEPYFCSLDLMVMPGGENEGQLVLGEIHDTLLLWGWALAFHPQEEEIRQRLWQLLEHVVKGTAVVNILSTQRLKIAPFEYPGYTVQLRTRSVSERNEKRTIADLYVRPGQNRLELFLARSPQEVVQVYNGELHSMLHKWFALPAVTAVRVVTGKHTPRVVINEVVYQREQWRLTREDGWRTNYNGDAFTLFYDMLKMQQAWEMPDYVFVKVSGEPKPFMIDFQNFFLLEMWEAFMKQEREAVVSEMLPRSEHFWLTNTQGEKYATEFRTAMFYCH
jgi:hypothetical protein